MHKTTQFSARWQLEDWFRYRRIFLHQNFNEERATASGHRWWPKITSHLIHGFIHFSNKYELLWTENTTLQANPIPDTEPSLRACLKQKIRGTKNRSMIFTHVESSKALQIHHLRVIHKKVYLKKQPLKMMLWNWFGMINTQKKKDWKKWENYPRTILLDEPLWGFGVWCFKHSLLES